MRRAALAALLFWPMPSGPAGAFDSAVLDSAVSVLPKWPGYEQGGVGAVPPGAAPEGTAVAIRPGGYLVTALHVVDRATAIDVRLRDGRFRSAFLVGRDPATDLALLKIDLDLPLRPERREAALGEPACAVGNQFGLGLTVTCGVVSATQVTDAGFNPIEDFVQTDATVNPGSSGGALVDRQGRLIGILSAIFTKESDADIGVNFAASMTLVARVVDDLIAHGRVVRVRPGFRTVELTREERTETAGVRVAGVLPDGPADRAGLAVGDILLAAGERTLRRTRDLTTALQLLRPGDRLSLRGLRSGAPIAVELSLPD